MIRFLVGATSSGDIHLHAWSDSDEIPWTTGQTYKPRPGHRFVLRADTQELGQGELEISSLSFISGVRRDYYKPVGAYFASSDVASSMSISAMESGGELQSIDTHLPVELRRPLSSVTSVSPGDADLYVDTHEMGRALEGPVKLQVDFG
jgi:hypothetical protein